MEESKESTSVEGGQGDQGDRGDLGNDLTTRFKGRAVLIKLLKHQSPAGLELIRKDYEIIRARIADAVAGPGRAVAVYKLIEQYRNPGKVQATCRSGCAACCHWKVSINREEADLLAMLVEHHKLDVDKPRLRIQKDFSEADFWKADELVSRCVFLKENKLCGIYDARPMVCRNHRVTSPPEKCEIPPDAEGKNTVQVVADLYPELIEAAYDDVVKEKGFLAEMLLERIED